MTTIQALETRYRGYRFRSRLEARWAVYFDTIRVTWEYEVQGYDLGDGLYYLPDFWLPQVNLWAEVKPGAFTADEIEKAARLATKTQHNVLTLVGPPALRCYPAVLWRDGEEGEAGEIDGEYCLTRHHGYPQTESRFFAYPGIRDGDEDEYARSFPDMLEGVLAARSARFEHGETPGGAW